MTLTRFKDFERKGDKENSAFFEEALRLIYDRRAKTGVDDMITGMRGVVVQVHTGHAVPYLAEVTLMTPYRLRKAYRGPSHRVYVMTVKPEYPTLFILEPIEHMYQDSFTRMNLNFVRAQETPNGRFLGEIYHVRNKGEMRKIMEAQDIRFSDTYNNQFLLNKHFTFTQPSPFTRNIVGYTEKDLVTWDDLELGTAFALTADQQKTVEASDRLQKEFGLDVLVHGIDHMASRVLCHSREDAILEFMTMTNYYFWGAYNIADMNSSTNVSRNPNVKNELLSPAKVFTANNVPFYLNSIERLPSPTEDFVRNFGPRMHHVAYEVEDGARPDGTKNIDYVVGQLQELGGEFLANIIGECTDFPDLKQIFSKSSPYSRLITEYVQRCKGYDGFFSKQNVAYLTQAAGLDEKIKEAHELGIGDS